MDIQTILLLAGLTQCLLSAMTWWVLQQQARSGVLWWCLGGLLTGIGLTLIALREQVPAFLSFEVANWLLISGLLMMAHALRWRPAPWHVPLAVTYSIVFLIVYSALNAWSLPGMRAAWSRSNGMLLLLVIAWNAWQLARAVRSFNARAIFLAFLGVAIAQAVLLSAGNASHDPRAHALVGWLDITEFLLAMVSSLCYIGLTVDRARAEESVHAGRQARWGEIRRRGHELAQLDRKRNITMLSAALAQDIGRPLAGIEQAVQQGLEALGQGQWSKSRLQDCFGRIIHATEQAGAATDRVRQFLKPPPDDRALVELRSLTERVLLLQAQELQARGIRVCWATDSQPGPVWGEGLQLSQAIHNLIRNAIEAMQESPRRELHLRCERRGQRVRLEIRDTGGGLPDGMVLYPGAILSSSKPNGLGLGIAVARTIIEQFEGNLLLEPAAGGLCAEIDLPAAGGQGEA